MKIPIDLYPDEYLRLVRMRLEMTQAELAKLLGIERRTISRYENGLFEIPQERMSMIKQMMDET
jgi:transcriptional regulator with XRE-family HTH domain